MHGSRIRPTRYAYNKYEHNKRPNKIARKKRTLGAKPLLPRPPVLTIVASAALGRAGAPPATALPLRRLPATASSRGGGVETAFQSLPMPKGTDEVWGSEAEMHEIAEAAAVAFSVLVLTTARFTEVCHWR